MLCLIMKHNEKKKYIANNADKTVRNTSKQACIVVGLGGKKTRCIINVGSTINENLFAFFFFFPLKIVCFSLLFRLFRLLRHDRKK